MHFLVLMIFLCAFCNLAEAQNSPVISGVVQDNTGAPISGVSVILKSSRTGVTTDETGKYSLPLPNGQKNGTIVFSYVGFITQSLAVPVSGILNVTLVNKTSQLSDVVVVGYGTQQKVDITGAVNQISSKDIENKPVLNTLQALQGESPNLIIQQSQLDPGSNVTINIRGVGTLGNNDPLIVIDGIIGGDLNTINPNDIASVSVLKDAGSAAIYGSRAANGVILVTTKSGRLDQKPTISYDGNYGSQEPDVLVQKVSAWDNAYYKNLSLLNFGLPPVYTPEQIQQLKEDGNGTWDVQHLLHNAILQSHNVSISGGGATNSYFISAG